MSTINCRRLMFCLFLLYGALIAFAGWYGAHWLIKIIWHDDISPWYLLVMVPATSIASGLAYSINASSQGPYR